MDRKNTKVPCDRPVINFKVKGLRLRLLISDKEKFHAFSVLFCFVCGDIIFAIRLSTYFVLYSEKHGLLWESYPERNKKQCGNFLRIEITSHNVSLHSSSKIYGLRCFKE